jgi:PAS domain S-box-containing protein
MEAPEHQWREWRDKVIGLGEHSSRKNYYPELQKRLQELRASEADLLMVFNSVNDAILIHDLNGRIVEANTAALKMYGMTRAQALELSIRDCSAPGPQVEQLPGILREVNQQQPRILLEWKARRPLEGTLFDAEVALQATKWRNHPMLVATIRDITERKQAEKKRQELEHQLAQAQKIESIGRLAGGVAHDFNNMLQVIIGNTSLALDLVPDNEQLHESLAEILKSAQRSAELTRQLLTFARKQTIQPRVMDLNETVQGMLKMLRRLIGENIELVWVPGNGLWPVKMDPSQLDQVLANLCVNARDAIPETGRVTLSTLNTSLDQTYFPVQTEGTPGDYVMLTVSDTGQGMDDATRKHLFEPFFTTKAPGQGTGLGLATVFGIVKQNAGHINVYSELGHGSTFKIYLPRAANREPTAQELAPNPQERLHGNETILLVEDELSVLGLAKRILEQHGYKVLPASQPAAATELAAGYSDKIDLLITDVIMPEANGRELFSRLLKHRPDLKCLFMSGYTADVIAHRGVLDEGLNFVQKPFSIQSLTQKVREVLDAKSPSSGTGLKSV